MGVMTENGNEHDDLQINIERFGPGPEAIDELSRAAFELPAVRERLRGKRNRLLSVELDDAEVDGKTDAPAPPDRYCTIIYDYDENQVISAVGRLDGRDYVEV